MGGLKKQRRAFFPESFDRDLVSQEDHDDIPRFRGVLLPHDDVVSFLDPLLAVVCAVLSVTNVPLNRS